MVQILGQFLGHSMVFRGPVRVYSPVNTGSLPRQNPHQNCMVMLAVEIKRLYLAGFKGVVLRLGRFWGKL